MVIVSAPELFLIAGCGGAPSNGAVSGKQTEPVYASDTGAITVTGAENFYADVLHQLGGHHPHRRLLGQGRRRRGSAASPE